jgi:hypothetical protein
MSTDDEDGIHLYGTPKKPGPPATEGLRGERTADNDEASNGETQGALRGQPPEKVEDRPNVSQVTPEDYPLDQRAKGET